MRLTIVFAALLTLLLPGTSAQALSIYPIHRAAILSGSHFDFKVEFDQPTTPDKIKVTINGEECGGTLGRAPEFIPEEKGVKASALLLRDAEIKKPGFYQVIATDGKQTEVATWEVYAASGPRKAKNVILFIGDGFSVAHRTAARILSRGISQGKYHAPLALDSMPHMALIGTSGVDSIVTDSANAMSAYTTGHKSSVNALGVYADRTPDTLDDPKVETIASLAKRMRGMAVGVVTNTEVEDATPAGMVAHTRRRSDYDVIVDQFYKSGVDVLMGGGAANFLPKSTPGSKRKDNLDYIAKFQQAGYTVATTDAEMRRAAGDPGTGKLLGLFHPSNMDTVYDRKFLKKGTVPQFPEQPDLPDMVTAALQLLSRQENGFVLMVESGLIDKQSHTLDWERSVLETILLDQAVAVAKAFAAERNDTLVLVTADHSHGLGIVGTVDDAKPGAEMREKVGAYEKAEYPNYPAAGPDGYPERLDVSRRLAIFYADFPDYYETFRPKLDGPFVPAVQNAQRDAVANEQYKNAPGAMFRAGNLPRDASQGVHTAEDVVLTAMGPGSERVMGFMENTDLFRVMADALGLGQ